MPRRSVVVSTAALLLLGAGCTEPVPRPRASAGPAAEPRTRTFHAGPDKITMEVLPLTRTGATVVLTVRATVDEVLGGGTTSMITTRFASRLSVDFDGGRLIDEAAGRAYQVARPTPYADCTCTKLLFVDAGATVPLQAAFSGIPASATKLTVMLPNAGVFTDVPIVDGEVPAPAASARNGVAKPLDLAAPGTSASGVLTAYIDRLDVPVTTTHTGDQVDIDLSADVLFRVDSAELTPASAKSIAAAVADLRRAGPGPLAVTGHTDSDGSTAHNQTLSEQRAATVATALDSALPVAQWPRTVTGRGETQPVVPNDSAAGKRLNRRVTISYETRAATPSSPSAGAPAAASMPATKGVLGWAPDGVRVKLIGSNRHGTLQITVQSATRRGDYVLVDLLARNVGADEADFWDFLGGNGRSRRFPTNPYTPFGSTSVRLLDGDTASYPLDYETERYVHACLCDRHIADKLPPGSERLLPVWYPAPPAGTTTVTIDVPDQFRITGVPLT